MACHYQIGRERRKEERKGEERAAKEGGRPPLPSLITSPLLSPLSHCSTKGCKQIMTAKPIVAAASFAAAPPPNEPFTALTHMHRRREREREKREKRDMLSISASLLSPSHLMMAFSPTYRASHFPPAPDAPPLRLAHFLPVVVFAVTSFSCCSW